MKVDFWSNRKLFRKKLKKIIGFRPKNLDLYKIAFIHKSASYADHRGNFINNERLEFLGDALLGAVIAEYLYKKYQKADEGFLSKNRSKLVNASTLYEIAQKLGLSDFLIYNSSFIKSNKSICSDAVEALIGAVFLDLGYKKTYKFIINRLMKFIDIEVFIKKEFNFKSRILEYCQKNKFQVDYNTVLQDKEKLEFKSEVFINNELKGSGVGGSKKEAEQKAFEQVFYKIFPDEKKDFKSSN